MAEEFVEMVYPESGAVANFATSSVAAWEESGWVRKDALPDPAPKPTNTPERQAAR